MQDETKTKDQLIIELHELRERIAESKKDITKRKRVEKRQELAVKILANLNQGDNTTDAIGDILVLIKKHTGIEAVGIRLREAEDFPYYQTIGFPSYFVEVERHLCARNKDGEIIRDLHGDPVFECMCGIVISGRTDPSFPFFSKNGSFWTNSTTELLASSSDEDRQSRTLNRCNGEGYESVALIPFRSNGETIGLLQLNDKRKRMFSLDEIEFFERVGESIGIAFRHKRAEEALQESEKRYRRLFESAKDGILILNADTGKVVDVNPFLLQLLGYSYDAIWGQHIWELGVFKDIAASKDAFKILQDNEYIRYDDLPLETLDQRQIAVEFVSNVYLVDHRKVIQCNIRDITGRKRADQRLRDLAAIVESSDDAIISMTLEGRILTWNKAAKRIYGYTAEEIVGQSVSILVPQDRPDELLEILAKLKSGETVTHYETVRVRKDGECIHVSLAISPLKDAKARIVGAATIARDITKRKRMEDELRKSHDELGILFRDLQEKSENLEEVNTALRVLLRQRDEDRKELGESVLANVRNLILPYVEKLNQSPLSSAQTTWMKILESHINEITSSFGRTLAAQYANLTSTEIRIATLIRDGRSTAQLAELLGIAERTVCRHRNNIRKKLGLRGGGINLRSHLLSLE